MELELGRAPGLFSAVTQTQSTKEGLVPQKTAVAGELAPLPESQVVRAHSICLSSSQLKQPTAGDVTFLP